MKRFRHAVLRLLSIADQPDDDDDARLKNRVGVGAGYFTIVAPLGVPLAASPPLVGWAVALGLSLWTTRLPALHSERASAIAQPTCGKVGAANVTPNGATIVRYPATTPTRFRRRVSSSSSGRSAMEIIRLTTSRRRCRTECRLSMAWLTSLRSGLKAEDSARVERFEPIPRTGRHLGPWPRPSSWPGRPAGAAGCGLAARLPVVPHAVTGW